MTDLHVIFAFGDFATTTARIEAVSKKGKAFFAKLLGRGHDSLTLPKTAVVGFTAFAAKEAGLAWQAFTPEAYASLHPRKAEIVLGRVISTTQDKSIRE